MIEYTDWMSTKETASYLGVTRRTLERWRAAGKPPEFFQYGKRVRYRKWALDNFLMDNRHR